MVSEAGNPCMNFRGTFLCLPFLLCLTSSHTLLLTHYLNITPIQSIHMSSDLKILEKLKYRPYAPPPLILLPAHTDKIILPEHILEIVVTLQKMHDIPRLPHPLVFRLSTPTSHTYVGVREFHDVDTETVYISEDVKQRLNLPSGDEHGDDVILSLELALNISGVDSSGKEEVNEKAFIEVEPAQGAFVRDWKTFLESTLSKSYTAVTTGDTLTFEVGGMEYVLNVLSVKTASGVRSVCVVDRDIELVVKTTPTSGVELADDGENNAKGNERQEPGVYTDLFGDVKGIIGVGQRVKVRVPGGMKFVSDGEFVLAFDQFVDENRFEYGSMHKPLKEWVNEFDDEVSVYVYALGIEKEKDTESGRDSEIEAINFNITAISEEEELEEETETIKGIDVNSYKCRYCEKIIAKASMLLHENFCRRNNVMCPNGCGRIFFKEIPSTHWHCCDTYGDGEFSKQLHVKYMHDDPLGITCEECTEYNCLKRYTLCEHVSRSCPSAIHECRYCHLIIPRGKASNEATFYDVSEHEWECGGKTTECPRCGRVIKMRDLETHMRLHEIMRVSLTVPTVCSNEMCMNIVEDEMGHANPVKLCNDCYGGLYSSVYDPDGKRLLQRIERRYILQIRNGCGRNNCENELCGSSEKCKIPQNVRVSMASVVSFVKGEIMKDFKDAHGYAFQFCVSEKMEARRRLVEVFEGGEWPLGWVCKANSVVGDDINAMNAWLEANGVRKEEYM